MALTKITETTAIQACLPPLGLLTKQQLPKTNQVMAEPSGRRFWMAKPHNYVTHRCKPDMGTRAHTHTHSRCSRRHVLLECSRVRCDSCAPLRIYGAAAHSLAKLPGRLRHALFGGGSGFHKLCIGGRQDSALTKLDRIVTKDMCKFA